MPITTIDQLKRALAVAEQIQKLEEEYAAIMGGKAPAAVSGAPAPSVNKKGKRKPFSAEARAKMAAAQKARWAKKNGAEPKAAKSSNSGKKTFSAEHKARLAAAQKARWAKAKIGK